MMEQFRTWHEILMERLSEPEDVISYLEVSLEEYLDDDDKAFFLKGIKNVIEAQGGILSVSEQADIRSEVSFRRCKQWIHATVSYP